VRVLRVARLGPEVNNLHYSMIIQWSDEDNTYIVTVPELPGCKTHGDTYEEAVKNGQEVMELCIASELELGRPIPTPNKYAAWQVPRIAS
jgi:predicted RNase H-like HicB family nuclease